MRYTLDLPRLNKDRKCQTTDGQKSQTPNIWITSDIAHT